MRFAFGILVVVALIGLHLAALFALLHPHVSPEYRAYYMDRVSTDWHVQQYPATPEQGIDLARPGWPEFVRSSFGISKQQSFGRWTDTQLGPQAGFEFNRSFTGPVCVVFNAKPSDSVRLHHVALKFGDQEKDIYFGQDQEIRPYLVDFDLPAPATRLALLFPRPLPRTSYSDPRQMGVGITRIRIFSQRCSELSQLVIEGR